MTDDDMGDLLAPKSQQLDAVDLISGDRTFTIERVTKTGGEQPLNIFFEEFDRPWRPGVNQRRVLGNVWGTKWGVWIGRQVRLQCDTTVVYGGKAVGGVRVTHMSHIEKRTPTPVIPTRGQGAIYNVDPLPTAPKSAPAAPEPTPTELAEQIVAALADCTTETEVRDWGNRAHARNLLDVQVNGQVVRDHVTYALAELAEVAS